MAAAMRRLDGDHPERAQTQVCHPECGRYWISDTARKVFENEPLMDAARRQARLGEIPVIPE